MKTEAFESQTRSNALLSMIAAFLMVGLSGQAMAGPLQDAVAAAEQQLGGEAYAAERYRDGGDVLVEVSLLSGDQIIEALFVADGNQLIEIDTFSGAGRVKRVGDALDRANLTLTEAAQIARNAVGSGGVVEAFLRIARKERVNGQRYFVEVRNPTGLYEVIVNSRTGAVISIRND